jgi:hypothetical protein
LLEKLNNLDVRILYVLMVIAATFPLLKPLGLPLPISAQVKASYNAIEANIKPNDLVFIGVDFGPTQEAELWPQLLAVGRHVASKGARILLMNMIEGGFRYEERFQEVLIKEFNMKYGENLLALPFSAGREAAFQSVVADLKGLYKVDLHGKPLTSFPLWNQIKGASDFKMYVQIADAPDWWLRPMSQVKGLLLWNGTVASGASTMAPLYQSGQMVGFIIGMTGGAEYEVLIKQPGPAAAAMDAQSMGHALIILFVILGNIGYHMAKRNEAKAKRTR